MLNRTPLTLAISGLQEVEIWYVAFDILYIKDTAVTGEPLEKRYQLLKDAIEPKESGAWRGLSYIMITPSLFSRRGTSAMPLPAEDRLCNTLHRGEEMQAGT